MKFLLFIIILILTVECKFEWKLKPKKNYKVFENETIKIDCEFESPIETYFVIWSKNGTTLALNNQLANLNSTNLEINGTYNLIIKNLKSTDSGIYTCQLFQSNDLFMNINLTVLVPPKYTKINIEKNYKVETASAIGNTELIEGDKIRLNCCTNSDVNPQVKFKWFKNDFELINSNNVKLLNNEFKLDDILCNSVELNVNRYDNNHEYKCVVSNEVLESGLNDSIRLTVEYKPQVILHVENFPKLLNKIDLMETIDTFDVKLFCNATANPDKNLVYEWYFNNNLLQGMNDQYLYLKTINQSGNYSCKCLNKHGYDQSYLFLNILYAHLRPLNNSSNSIDDSNEIILIKSSTNSNLTLNCELKTNLNSNDVKITWFYYKFENEKFTSKRLKLSYLNGLIKLQTNVKTADGYKVLTSRLTLNELRSNQFGYYMCSLENYQIKSSLLPKEQTLDLNLNSTYFLQIQFAPEIKMNKKNLFANNNDQLELVCEIESNPESIFVWQLNDREISNSYKFNITTKIIYKNNDYNELNKISFIHSKLVINSISSFDYGVYWCRARNVIGEAMDSIKVERKRVPDIVTNLTVTKVDTNSLTLNWLSGSNGGEHQIFLININNSFNITVPTVENPAQQNENLNESIEIKNLESFKTYEIKLLSYNNIGWSNFSELITVETLEKRFLADNSIRILNAKYNAPEEIRKKSNDEICFEARTAECADKLALKINIISNNISNEIVIDEYKVTNGLNCIQYSKYLNNKSIPEPHLVAYLISDTIKQSSDDSEIRRSTIAKTSSIPRIGISLCSTNDTSVCTEEVIIVDNIVDISNHFTLLTIGSVILFLITILILCSIWCCRQNNKKKKNNNSSSKMVVKTIPNSISISYPNIQQQKDVVDCNISDSSVKSTQNILSNNFYLIAPLDTNIQVSDESSSSTNSNNNKYCNFNQPKNNASSVLTVESDVISSTSSSAISSTGEVASVQSKTNNNVNSGYKLNECNKNLSISRQALLFAPQTNIYSVKSPKQQPTFSDQSAESGYSTPTNHFNKKLFYEVIV